MNIFLRELKSNFRSLIIWGVIVVLFVWVGMSKFSAYEGNPEMLAILDNLPQALLTAFSFNAFNLTTVTGFMGVMFIYYALMGCISAAMWGSDIISKEERDKTVEFALTLPVPRWRLVTAKILAAFVNCVALLLIIWGVTLASAAPYEPDSDFYSFLTLCMVSVFIMQMIFLALGIFLGCSMKRYKLAGSVAVGVLLGTYFLSVVAGLSEDFDFLKYFTPFKYFDPGLLLRESSLDVTFVLLSVGIIIVLLVGGYVTYSRRDLYI